MSSGGQSAPSPNVPWAGVGEGAVWAIDGKNWYETAIPEGPERDFIRAKNYANPGVVAKSLYELNRSTTHLRDPKNSVSIPGDNASPDDLNAFFKALGRPDTPDGYDVDFGQNPDKAAVDWLKKTAHGMGLNKKQTAQLVKEWNAFAGARNQQTTDDNARQNETIVNELKTKWGPNFAQHFAAGDRVIKALDKKGFGEEDLAALEKAIGVAPVVKLLATLGMLSGEGGLALDGGTSGVGGEIAAMSPEQANSKIAQMQSDGEFQKKYTDRNHPEHKQSVEYMAKLYERAGNTVVL